MPRDILDLPPPAGAERIAYGPDAQQFGHLRLPAGPGPHPLLMFVHGGFWRNRYGLEYTGHLCSALAAGGIGSWSIEYRRVGDPLGGWPATAQDALIGAGMLGTVAANRPIDMERVVIAGHSAGGHLAVWIAAQGVVNLKRAISLAGVVDLHRAFELGIGDDAVEQFLGGNPEDARQAYKIACPMELLPISVPQLLIHGTADDVVPIELSERFAARSVNAQLHRLDGADHFDVVDPRSRYWPVVYELLLGSV